MKATRKPATPETVTVSTLDARYKKWQTKWEENRDRKVAEFRDHIEFCKDSIKDWHRWIKMYKTMKMNRVCLTCDTTREQSGDYCQHCGTKLVHIVLRKAGVK